MSEENQQPDLREVPINDLCALLLACSMSNDKTDKDFAKACRDELSRRKPDDSKGRFK